MTTPNNGWALDADTWMVAPLDYPAAGSPYTQFPIITQADTYLMSAPLGGSNPPPATGFFPGTSMIWYPPGVASFGYYARDGLNARSIPLDRATSSYWTHDCIVYQPTAGGGCNDVWQWYDNVAALVNLQILANGDVVCIATTTGGGTFTATAAGYFPKATFQHLRVILDYVAKQIRVYAGEVGAVPSLIASAAIDTNPIANIAHFYTGDNNGGLSFASGFGVQFHRLSFIARTDAFPVGAPVVPPPTFTAAYAPGANPAAGGTVTCTFNKAIFETETLRAPATWTITPPGGQPAVRVTGVRFVNAQTVALAVYGDVRLGGTYHVVVPTGDVASTDLAFMAGGTGDQTFNIVASGGAAPAPYAPGPHIENVAPAAGTAILSTNTLAFDLLDYDAAVVLAAVAANFPKAGVTELVHDGTAFTARYAASSARVGTEFGWHYTVVRAGGWPESPTLEAVAADANGTVL